MNHTMITPAYMTIPDACRYFGTSRSTLYLRAQQGHIKLKKHGGRTLVVMQSAIAYFGDLPEITLCKR